jgi:hypothetical protein
MTTDNWFAAIVFFAVYVLAIMLLDGAHKAHISALKQVHNAELAGLRGYIRTLNRERKWLEAELARVKAKMALRQEVGYDPVHIQYLPPSEEYDGDG